MGQCWIRRRNGQLQANGGCPTAAAAQASRIEQYIESGQSLNDETTHLTVRSDAQVLEQVGRSNCRRVSARAYAEIETPAIVTPFDFFSTRSRRKGQPLEPMMRWRYHESALPFPKTKHSMRSAALGPWGARDDERREKHVGRRAYPTLSLSSSTLIPLSPQVTFRR